MTDTSQSTNKLFKMAGTANTVHIDKHHLEGLTHSQWVPCTSSWVPGGAPSAGWPSACTGLFPADRYPAPWTEWAGPLSYSPACAYTLETTTNTGTQGQKRRQWYYDMHYCALKINLDLDTVNCRSSSSVCWFCDHRSTSVSSLYGIIQLVPFIIISYRLYLLMETVKLLNCRSDTNPGQLPTGGKTHTGAKCLKCR